MWCVIFSSPSRIAFYIYLSLFCNLGVSWTPTVVETCRGETKGWNGVCMGRLSSAQPSPPAVSSISPICVVLLREGRKENTRNLQSGWVCELSSPRMNANFSPIPPSVLCHNEEKKISSFPLLFETESHSTDLLTQTACKSPYQAGAVSLALPNIYWFNQHVAITG